MNIVVVNTGVGNVGAIPNMLKRLGAKAQITSKADEVASAECLIVPGVGSFDAGVSKLRETGLWQALDGKAREDRTPILGICLGMQLMAESSEEGREPGFGWVPGRLRRFRPEDGGGQPIRVPHMGWNVIEKIGEHELYRGMQDEARFYFDHSFYLALENDALYCGEAQHGVRFAAGLQRGKLIGVQFHPEKSHRFGLKLLENFLKLASAA